MNEAIGLTYETDAIRAADLSSCFIQIEHGGDLVLAILLARDGSITRKGDGSPSPADDTLYIGAVKEPLFDQLMEVVPDEFFRYVGRLELENRQGVDTTLSVTFQHDDGRGLPFEILFGSESGGVPREAQAILRRALELSDEWWNGQRAKNEGRCPHGRMSETLPLPGSCSSGPSHQGLPADPEGIGARLGP